MRKETESKCKEDFLHALDRAIELNLPDSVSDYFIRGFVDLIDWFEEIEKQSFKKDSSKNILSLQHVSINWVFYEVTGKRMPSDYSARCPQIFQSYDRDRFRKHLACSKEGRHAVCRAYREVLFREPDPKGENDYCLKLGSGEMNWWELRDSLLASEEMQERLGNSQVGDNQHIPCVQNKKNINIGNILHPYDGVLAQSSMTMMSPYWSDEDRQRFIDLHQSHGMDLLHLYGVNDDNYSGKKANEGPGDWQNARYQPVFFKFAGQIDENVEMPESWYRRTPQEDLAHWLHWFCRIREAGMQICLWLWPNQAVDSFNNPQKWPDERIVSYNRKLINEVANYNWHNSPLVSEVCLKLEADDEWSARGDDSRVVNLCRLNDLARAHRKFINRQTFWWHNEDQDPRIWSMLDWKPFDGIRIQTGNCSEDRLGFKQHVRSLVNQIPSNKKFYISEYYFQPTWENPLGDAILDISEEWGSRFQGLDNGASRQAIQHYRVSRERIKV